MKMCIIASYNKALEFSLDSPNIFYNKSRCYALQTNTEAALENLSRVIALNPDKYREMAKTDSDFSPFKTVCNFRPSLPDRYSAPQPGNRDCMTKVYD
jgi:tetratricopeptide (TPR) repeat protein